MVCRADLSLPTDRKDMEQAAQKWFFGDKPIPGPGSGTRAPSSPANMTSSDSRSRAGTTTSAAGSAPSSRSRADTTVSTASSSSTATFGTAPSSPMVSATSRTQPVPSDAISGGSTTGSAPPPPRKFISSVHVIEDSLMSSRYYYRTWSSRAWPEVLKAGRIRAALKKKSPYGGSGPPA